jgi:glycerol-3-phosphate dehydrogenase
LHAIFAGDQSQEACIFDLIIIGGGINGAGIARDAAGRGLSVALFEQNDLAEHTSSASTKLIHGGLRYLEHYEFRLVREALIEREILLRIAPHIIWPLEFWLPHGRNQRPAWMIRLGLFLYDHLARREVLPSSHAVRLKKSDILKPVYKKAFSYADCWVEDSRLVVLNAMDAAKRGAKIFTRTKVLSAQPQGRIWQVETEAGAYTSRAIVNAAGPWVSDVLTHTLGRNTAHGVRLVKGSHIITDRLYPDDQAFILQNPDKRIVFVIPYERKFSLIGTTDIPYDSDPAAVRIADDEIEYLCTSVNRYFKRAITADDVLWTFSGVRPLFDDHKSAASAVTRDYVLDLAKTPGWPPLLSVFGGKITTYRKLAEHALAKLLPAIDRKIGKSWTAGASLPGGDIQDFDEFEKMLRVRNGHLDAANLHRLAYSYGTLTERFVGYDMGEDFGGGLHRSEVDYLVKHEWARTAEDILWRRTKLGLHVPEDTPTRLGAYLSTKVRA